MKRLAVTLLLSVCACASTYNPPGEEAPQSQLQLALDSVAKLQASPEYRAQQDSVRYGFQLVRSHDDFNGIAYAASRLLNDPWVSAVAQCSGANAPSIAMLVAHVEPKSSRPFYALRVAVTLAGDLLLSTGTDSLLALVDGRRMAFAPASGSRLDVGEFGSVREDQAFLITRDELLRLARADTLRFRVSGERGNCDFTLPAKSVSWLRAFTAAEAP